MSSMRREHWQLTLSSENSRTTLQRAAMAADCTVCAGSVRRRQREAATAGLHSSPRRSLALRDSACTAPHADARTAELDASAPTVADCHEHCVHSMQVPIDA